MSSRNVGSAEHNPALFATRPACASVIAEPPRLPVAGRGRAWLLAVVLGATFDRPSLALGGLRVEDAFVLSIGKLAAGQASYVLSAFALTPAAIISDANGRRGAPRAEPDLSHSA